MTLAAAPPDAGPLTFGLRMALAARRFNAWWEGYAFDAAAERAELFRALRARREGARLPPHQDISQSIWGEGRFDPGDAAWSMRHARTLGAALKAQVVVLGAGAGGPIKDLKNGTRWKITGYSRIAERIKSLDVSPYETALSRINRAGADAGLCFFELHRDADPAMIAMFAAELVRPNAPFVFVDFTVARKGARLKSCFADPWDGAPRQPDQVSEMLDRAGFRVGDANDETRSFLPLITRGWARWRTAYQRALDFPKGEARSDYLRLLSAYAHIWAERSDAIKAGQLQVMRFQARRKG
ncbi:MAG: hypothetical protein U5J99_10660 [Parvularculaceae bacterium]|nr:hypothetical protein [Parvularculaceae bacterium]